jgi:hypothetical protein
LNSLLVPYSLKFAKNKKRYKVLYLISTQHSDSHNYITFDESTNIQFDKGQQAFGIKERDHGIKGRI